LAPAHAGPRALDRDVAVRLILASASPRRADLLRAAGIEFEVQPADVDESVRDAEAPADYVRRLAHTKADAVAARVAGRVVLAADTAVVVDGQILGKPADDADAARMLRLLSGRTHEVLTGVCVTAGSLSLVEVACTRVEFAPLSAEDIAWYVSTGEPMDKAGAYGVQGLASRFVTAVHGSYSNVVGLPVALVSDMLKQICA
jgi:septum formation protein